MNLSDLAPWILGGLEVVAIFVVCLWKGYLGSFMTRPFFAPSSASHFQAGIVALRAEREAKHAKALAERLGTVLDASFPDPFLLPANPSQVATTPPGPSPNP